jgi:hypothetical protein
MIFCGIWTAMMQHSELPHDIQVVMKRIAELFDLQLGTRSHQILTPKVRLTERQVEKDACPAAEDSKCILVNEEMTIDVRYLIASSVSFMQSLITFAGGFCNAAVGGVREERKNSAHPNVALEGQHCVHST